MTIAGGIETANLLLDLFDRLAGLVQARQQAAADMAASRTAIDTANAATRMQLAHDAAVEVHQEIQALLTSSAGEGTGGTGGAK